MQKNSITRKSMISAHTVRVHTIRRGAMLCCKSVVKAEEARLQQCNGTISCDRITLVTVLCIMRMYIDCDCMYVDTKGM